MSLYPDRPLTKLEEELYVWFQEPHTLVETINKFNPKYNYVVSMVDTLERDGIIRKKDGYRYKLSVEAEPEYDIGV